MGTGIPLRPGYLREDERPRRIPWRWFRGADRRHCCGRPARGVGGTRQEAVHRHARPVQLITGEEGCTEGFAAVRRRIPRVTANFRKEITQAQKMYTPESIQARLASPFTLPQNASYPPIVTVRKAKKSASHTHPGELQHLLLPALHAERAPHDDNSITPVHLLRLRPQHPAPRRRQHRRRQRRRRGRRSRPCRQWTPMAKL